jgi:hypothetical protein
VDSCKVQSIAEANKLFQSGRCFTLVEVSGRTSSISGRFHSEMNIEDPGLSETRKILCQLAQSSSYVKNTLLLNG